MFTDTQRMICDSRWKLILYPKVERVQLFDLQTDPNELHDLSSNSENASRLEAMLTRLNQWRAANDDPLR